LEEKEMKAKKILREIIITLAIILVSITAFIGFYLPNLNGVKDIIPEYLLGMELSKYRVFELVPNTGTRTINYDANGKEIPSDDKDKEVASSEEKPYNNPDVLNEENYKATKTVIENGSLFFIGLTIFTVFFDSIQYAEYSSISILVLPNPICFTNTLSFKYP
jgi:hypothetical protein